VTIADENLNQVQVDGNYVVLVYLPLGEVGVVFSQIPGGEFGRS